MLFKQYFVDCCGHTLVTVTSISCNLHMWHIEVFYYVVHRRCTSLLKKEQLCESFYNVYSDWFPRRTLECYAGAGIEQ